MDLKKYIVDVEDFPVKGIVFKDTTPLIKNNLAFKKAIRELANLAKESSPTVILSPEARGFIFGAAVALKLNLGFVPVRKPGKLPRTTISKAYDLEYGQNVLFMHQDALKKGDRVVIVDDLLATGGTIKAIIDMVLELGATVVGVVCLIELDFLLAQKSLEKFNIRSLIHY